MFENIGPGHGLESSMQSGSSSRAIGDAIGEQQSKRTRSGAAAGGGGKRGAAVEADAAIGPGSSS